MFILRNINHEQQLQNEQSTKKQRIDRKIISNVNIK